MEEKEPTFTLMLSCFPLHASISNYFSNDLLHTYTQWKQETFLIPHIIEKNKQDALK